ncbi:hypothetical protein S7711_11052 [Stachybotrys chartarum IBT 7711]|uniref:Uncharacterized protein n=1 Tax=Stachybotrys chartarum (strain CBS 109288 / IBT 7711) TaxID=1280523 RepID=A0A084B2K5_STACB|nr:hypothetical protein S7711_11052 [Stachybotrys chartarum IBT 7711]
MLLYSFRARHCYSHDLGLLILRLHPSIPVQSRAAIKTTTLPVGGGPDGKSPVLTNTAKMQISLDWSFGKAASQGTSDEHLYLSAVGLESVLNPEESALLESLYAVARVIHVYPYINVPDGEPEVDVGEGRQVLTLAVSWADGCRGSLGTQA